jgi:hypothetical protein
MLAVDKGALPFSFVRANPPFSFPPPPNLLPSEKQLSNFGGGRR